ncbi:hypothetical protein F4803DRAFT_47850 [Xylaria telfairii]|nr:hypothetical protein F4803DRAFT_47850 [Xylaria telfairii]
MKSAIVLLASSSCAHAAWLRWSVNREAVRPAQETGRIAETAQIGWTPIPTPAPGVRSDGEVVLDLLKRQTSKTDWTNSETCGWFSGISSSAVLCGDGFTCATNSDHAVACASGTISPFFTACLDYSAFQAGSCLSLDAATGCCQVETEPACGTYIWTGSPERFMYKCFEKASIISILDVPQFVVDASLFSKTHTTPTITPTETATKSNSGSASTPNNTGGSNPGSGGVDPAPGSSGGTPGTGSNSGSGSGSGSNGSDGSNGANTSNGSNNTGTIVGAVVGGLAGLLLLLLLLLFCLRRKTKGKLGLGFTRNKKNKKEDKSSKAYHTTNVAAAAAKGRNSSGSEATTAMPISMQQPRQYHYHNQEQQHYHPQAQIQPQIQPQNLHLQQLQSQQPPPPQIPTAGQPIAMSYTVNEGPTHVSQSSYSVDASRTTMPTAMPTSSSSSGDLSRILVGANLPISHNSHENQQQNQPQQQQQQQQQPPQTYFQQPPQGQPQFQQFQQVPQQQQQGIPSQLQPVNHFHLYYAPPTQQQGGPSTTSQFTSPAADGQARGGVSPDALGVFTPAANEQRAPSRDRSQDPEEDSIPAYYGGHTRDASSSSRRNRSPSPDVDAEWLARGPGYRQSM